MPRRACGRQGEGAALLLHFGRPGKRVKREKRQEFAGDTGSG
jgi:hypothetical protein